MDVYKKNVYLAYKHNNEKNIPGVELSVFIKVGHNDYREVKDLYNADCPYLPKCMIIKSEMPKYAEKSKENEFLTIDHITPMFKDFSKKDKIDLCLILFNFYNKDLPLTNCDNLGD